MRHVHFIAVAGLAASASLAAGAGHAATEDPAARRVPDHVSCTGAPNEIVVRISDVKESVGLIAADLYPNAEDGFLKGEGRIKQVRFAAHAPVTEFCIRAPKSENYAIAVYHDRNANMRFDKNALGLPAEPYGVSNNPPMRFAAPTVAEALFTVAPEGAKVEIELRK